MSLFFLKGKKMKKDNFLDQIPTVNKEWKFLKDGMVEIKVENKGFYNTLAQKLYKKPRFSYIKLDAYGSFVWQQIDGKKTIYEIGQLLASEHEGAADSLYERLAKYIGILARNKYVVLK